MSKDLKDFAPTVQARGEALYHHVDAVVLAALNELSQESGPQSKDRTSAMYTALMSAGPAVCFISKLLAKSEDGDHIKSDATDKELPLVTGLILGRVIQIEKEGIRLDFTPRNVLAAIEAASKIAGYDIRPLLESKMLEAYGRGVEAEGATSLGYWDHLPSVTPQFDEFAEQLKNVAAPFSRSKH